MKKNLLSTVAFLGCAFVSMGQSVPNYVPKSGLVGWWPFNGNAIDSSGNGNNGTVNGATLTNDRFGVSNGAYYYSSAGCATSIDAIVNTSSINSAFTISYWMERNGNGCMYSCRIWEFRPGPAGAVPGALEAYWYNSSIVAGIDQVTSTSAVISNTTNALLDNEWINIIYTNNGTLAKLWVNGILTDSAINTGSISLASHFSIGRMGHAAYNAFNGKIDDFGLWNRALTDCEISKLYLASNTFFTSKPADQTVKIGTTASFTVKDTLGTSATYQWQENSGTGFVNLTNTSPYSGVTTKTLNISPVAVGMHNNQYRCIRNSATSCLDTSAAAVLTISNLGITPNQLGSLSIAPNPVQHIVTINAAYKINKLVLLNLMGQAIYESNPDANTSSIDMSQYPTGIYILKVNDVLVEKIIKE